MKGKLTRRNFVKLAGMAVAMTALPGCAIFAADTTEKSREQRKKLPVLVANIMFPIMNGRGQSLWFTLPVICRRQGC